MVYQRTFDNQLKGLARGSKNVEELFEMASVKEDWDKVVSQRENELVTEATKNKLQDDPSAAAAEEGEASLQLLRKPPSEFKEHSLPYWKALANTSVRRYVSFSTKPSTQAAMTRLVAQSSLKDTVLNEGSKRLGLFDL